jgi:hypothetical protein
MIQLVGSRRRIDWGEMLGIGTEQYNIALWIWIAIASLTFLTLMFVRAPYGRHERPGWGPRISSRLGWIIMESPSVIVMSIFFGIYAVKWGTTDWVAITFFIMWISHYSHRSFIWPVRAKVAHKMMPLSIVLFAIIFNGINTWFNAEWIYALNHPYPEYWFYGWKFRVGALIFISGMMINITSDNILFSLRNGENKGYSIPHEGLHKWVSCPNYLGEILQWIGWAIATWSLAGLSFALWTIANLAPRARANHIWYHEQFPDYPKNRKALIPGIY